MESATSQIATSVALGAWQVHAFFRNVKNPDPTVNLFVSGLESLAVACEAVGTLVKERTDQREEQLQQLWECLESRLRASNDTISQLELAVDSAKLGKKDKSPFGRMIRQVRTSGKPKEVEAARSEIHAHTTCLQMILHVARIKTLYLLPGTIDSQLPTELAQLKEKKQELQKIRAQRDPKRINILNKNETQLLFIGDAVIFNGETLYASGLLSPSAAGDRTSDRANYTQRWVGNLPYNPKTPETDTPSVFSHPRSTRASTQLTPDTEVRSTFSHPRDARASVMKDVTGDENSVVQYSVSRYEDSDLESDDEIEIETLNRLISSARTFFETTDFEEASLRLGEALKLAQELPTKRQGLYDLWELRYMAGICAFHLQDASAALPALETAVEGNSKSASQTDASRLQFLEASHLLSMTYLQLGMLDRARSTCQEALKGRRRLLGKENKLYYESLELMAKIWEADNNPIRAQVYRDMVAGEATNSRVEALSGISTLSSSRNSLPIDVPTSQVQPSKGNEDSFKEVPAVAERASVVKRKPLVNITEQEPESNQDTYKEISLPSARIVDVNFGPLIQDAAKPTSTTYPYPFTWTDNSQTTPLGIVRHSTGQPNQGVKPVPSPITHLDSGEQTPTQSDRGVTPIERQKVLADRVARESTPVEPLVAPVRTPISPLDVARPASAPIQHYSPPVQPYNPPVQSYTPPVQPYTPPVQPYAPPSQPYTRPVEPYTPPVQPYNPPGQSASVDYHNWRSAGLRKLAESMAYRKPAPADLNFRQMWRMFLNVVPKKELTSALLEHRMQDALSLIPDGNLKKAKPWSRKPQKLGKNPMIDRKDLLLASLFGDTEVVEKLITNGADLVEYNREDLDGLSALHCAALGGHYDIAAKLIVAGSPVEIVLEKFGTPLSLAVLGERIDMIDLLLGHTADPHMRCGNLGSVIHAACATGNAALVSALSERTRKEALGTSRIAFPGTIRKLRSMFVSRTLLNPPDEAMLVPTSPARLDHLDAPPLALAAYMGHEKVVEYLTKEKKVDVNAKCGAWSAPNMADPQGSNEHTALTIAAASGQDAIARLLVQQGASVAPKNFEREDALLVAIVNDRTTCALLLLECGAPVSSVCFREATNRSMLPLVAKMRAKRSGLQSSMQSTYSLDKVGGTVTSVESVS